MIDGRIVRAHQHAAGAKGGQQAQGLGWSRGGFSSKIHAKVDAFGLPLAFRLTGGESAEIKEAEALLQNEPCDYLLADKAYDSDAFRDELKRQGIEPVIPGRAQRQEPIDYDDHIYKERNWIEH
jgi:transposase